MDSGEFAYFRKQMKKTQKQMAHLIGKSVKTVHSYEQGWRTVPSHVERQILFLVTRAGKRSGNPKPCWVITKCPTEQKKLCPAWEFKAGNLCWYINGTLCDGEPKKNWNEKIKICRSCEVFTFIE